MRRRTGVAVLVALAATLGACGGSDDPDNAITVYSGQHEQTMAKLVADFKQRTKIEINLRTNSESAHANTLLREGAATPADVFITENPPALTVVERKGLFAPVDAATLAKTPAQYNSPKRDWVGVSARSAVLVYNPAKLSAAELPHKLRELAEPKWKGIIGFAPAESDFHTLITALVKLHGVGAATDWLEGMKRNGKVYDGNMAIVRAVNRGEISAGLIDHYYYYRTRDEIGKSKTTAQLHYFDPGDAGAVVDVSGAAALKSSSDLKLAQRFLAYLVSEPAQEIIATSDSYEYPLAAGVQSKRDIKPFAQLKPPDVSVEDLGDGRQALDLLQQVGLL